MEEYIKRGQAKRAACEGCNAEFGEDACEPCDCSLMGAIDSIPAADVRPVVRGKWIKPARVPDSMLDECSVCGFDTGAYTFNFCPNCGAWMEES